MLRSRHYHVRRGGQEGFGGEACTCWNNLVEASQATLGGRLGEFPLGVKEGRWRVWEREREYTRFIDSDLGLAPRAAQYFGTNGVIIYIIPIIHIKEWRLTHHPIIELILFFLVYIIICYISILDDSLSNLHSSRTPLLSQIPTNDNNQRSNKPTLTMAANK